MTQSEISIETHSPPPQFGPYRVQDRLGAGSMGVVYRAVHVETGQPAAVKVSQAPHTHAIAALRREVQGLSRLAHPGIARIQAQGTQDGLPWVAMDLISGPPLDRVLDEIWSVVPETSGARRPAAAGQLLRVLGILRHVCQTLAYLHGEGIVHRDLKPANILLRQDDLPVLVDFGISHTVIGASGREALDVDRAVSGTPAYIAPEQLRGEPPDVRMDLYAIGCLLYTVVCGRPPFLAVRGGASVVQQHLTSPPPAPSAIVSGVPDALEALILSLLEKAPRCRPGHADDVGAALDALGTAPHPELSRPAPKPYLYRAPFAGQASVRSALQAKLQAARRGEGRITVLLGPSGSGKTRLLLELADDARRLGLRVITADCASAAIIDSAPVAPAGGPLGAFRSLLGAVADECIARGAATTAQLLGRHLPVLAALAPRLADLPGAAAYPPPPPLVGRDAAERAQRALVDTLAAWTTHAPSLLIIDDIQWADDISLGALALLARDPPHRLDAVVLLACRSEAISPEIEALMASPSIGTLAVEPLRAMDIAEIAEGMTAVNYLPDALLAFLVEHSSGSPLVVSEYLWAAVAEGILIRREGHWVLRDEDQHRFASADRASARHLEALARVDGVDALMALRLTQLPDDARRLLEAGAVWGRVWREDDAARTAGLSAAAALDAVTILLARQIVVESGDGALRFAHDRLWETVVTSTPAAAVPRLHIAVARALEAQSQTAAAAAGSAKTRAIALHFRLGGAQQEAFRYAALAGRQALQQGAYREAIEELKAALALATAPGTVVESTVLERARLHHSLGDALYVAGDLLSMGDHLTAGVDTLGVMRTPRSDAAWGLRALWSAVHRVLVALLPARLGHVQGEHRERVAETGYLLSRLSEPYLYSDRPLAYLGTNLTASLLAARSQDAETIAWVDVVLGTVISTVGLSGLARRFMTNARTHAARSDSADVQLYQAQIESYFWSLELDWAQATATIDGALARSRSLGTAFRTEQILIVSVLVRNVCGDLLRAIVDARELVRSARTWGHWLNEALGEMLLGLALLLAGERREAQEALAVAARMLHKPHLVVQRANCHAGQAAALLQAGDLEGALREVALVEELVPQLAPSNPVAGAIHRYVPLVRLAALEQAQPHSSGSERLALEAAAAVRSCVRFSRIMRSARPMALRHKAHLAVLQGRPQQALRYARESLTAARRLRLPLEEAEAQLLLARLAPDTAGSATAAARALFVAAELPLLAARCHTQAASPGLAGPDS